MLYFWLPGHHKAQHHEEILHSWREKGELFQEMDIERQEIFLYLGRKNLTLDYLQKGIEKDMCFD